MNHEVMMYAIAQKEQLGFDKAVEECSAPMPATTIIVFLLTFAFLCTAEYRMSRYGVTPNVNQPPTRTYALPIRAPFDACACARADDDHAAVRSAARNRRRRARSLTVCARIRVRRQMLLYMALAPEQKLTYKEAGPAGVAAFEAGVAGQEARAFRGCG